MFGGSMRLAVTVIVTSGLGTAAPAAAPEALAPQVEMREILESARGVSPAMCALAADGAMTVGRWGGGWDVPAAPIASDVRASVRRISRSQLSSSEARTLLDGLGADDACVRYLAATLIGRADDESLVDGLTTRLSARGAVGERQGAALALGLIASKRSAQSLVSALRDQAPEVRANVAWALGRIGDKTTARALLGVVRDNSASVRKASIVALGRMQQAPSIEELLRILKEDEAPEVRRVAAWALGQMSARAAGEGLAAALRQDRDADVREMAAWALAELKTRDATDILIAALKSDQSDDVRETAAWALGELDANTGVDALSEAVTSDRSADVRGTSAWALGTIHPRQAPRALLRGMRDSDADVRLKSAWALSQIGDPEVVQDITAAMRTEKNADVIKAQMRALLEGGERSEEALRGLLKSDDTETREMAVRALVGRRGPWPWPWPWPRPRPNP